MEAAKEVLATSSGLRKASANYSINFMALQKLCRKPEENVRGTSTEFYYNSAKDYDKHKFECQNIYNVNRMLQYLSKRPSIIVAVKGMKQVRAVTSAERGSGHHGCGCRRQWSFYPAILRFPREEPHCKGTRWQCWICRQVRVDDRR